MLCRYFWSLVALSRLLVRKRSVASWLAYGRQTDGPICLVGLGSALSSSVGLIARSHHSRWWGLDRRTPAAAQPVRCCAHRQLLLGGRCERPALALHVECASIPLLSSRELSSRAHPVACGRIRLPIAHSLSVPPRALDWIGSAHATVRHCERHVRVPKEYSLRLLGPPWRATTGCWGH